VGIGRGGYRACVRLAAPVCMLVVVVCVAACGSGSPSSVAVPRFPRGLAETLANQSEALAAFIRRGDGCAARRRAQLLEQEASSAIAANRVPKAYRSALAKGVRQASAHLPACPSTQAAPPPPLTTQTPAHDQRDHTNHHPGGGGDQNQGNDGNQNQGDQGGD